MTMTNELVKNEKSCHSDELKTCYIMTSSTSSILHPTAPASLLNRPSTYVGVTAVAFTYGKAHSKPAWDHLHLTCPSCRRGGVTSHGVTSYPCSLFMLSWNYPPPQLHCSLLPVLSMQMGTLKGHLGRPIPQFKLWSGRAITTCQSDIRAPNRTQWDDTAVQDLLCCWSCGADGERRGEEGEIKSRTDHITNKQKKKLCVSPRNGRNVRQRTGWR